MGKKILIAYVSAGSGHKSAALALEGAFASDNSDVEIKTVDTLDYTNPVYKKMYVSAYINLVKNTPELWGYVYRSYDTQKVSGGIEKIRKVFDEFNAMGFIKLIQDYKPDIIIGTHFFPMQIVSHLKKEKKIKAFLAGTVTDYGAHSLWMQSNVDIYFVPTEEVKRELVRFGQPEEKIKITGIPVDLLFSKRYDKDAIRQKLGMEKEKITLLLLSGGYGVGPVTEFIKSFQTKKLPVQFIIVCGKDEKLKKEAEKISKGLNAKIFGFVNNVYELMEASDIIATKPGGLTSTEILAKNKPMIILDPIPGQEQRNCEYLLENGVAVRLFDPKDAPYKIEELLKNKTKLFEMNKNVQKIAKPNAAIDIAEEAMSLCLQKRIFLDE